MTVRGVLATVRPADAAVMVNWLLLALVGLVAGDRLALLNPPPDAFQPPRSGVAFAGLCLALAAICAAGIAATAGRPLRQRLALRAPLLVGAGVVAAFVIVLTALPALTGARFTGSAAAVDRWLGGGATFAGPVSAATHPAIAELLQFAYATYYLLPLAVWVELLVANRLRAADRFAFVAVASLLVSYWGYLAFPTAPPAAIDPGYTVPLTHLTPVGEWLHAAIDRGEPAAWMTGEPTAVYDCFPSGHAMLSLLTAWSAWRLRLRARWPVAVLAGLICAATVYLRYHWAIDVVAGALLAALLGWLLPRGYRMWETASGISYSDGPAARPAAEAFDA